MDAKLKPTSATTSTGAQLPLVALPQLELLTVNESEIPLLKNALGDGVHFKPLRLDMETGIWVILATFEAGTRVPLHYHTGTVDAYTLSGGWHYIEYPDQMQVAGSYLFEPGGSVHTLACPETNTEDTLVLFIINGANVNFTDDGQFHSILDATSIAFLTEGLAKSQGVDTPNYINGGAAKAMAKS